MEPRSISPRGFTSEQRGLLWMWHREGVSRRGIAERLGKLPGSVHFIIREAGGIAPRQRIRLASEQAHRPSCNEHGKAHNSSGVQCAARNRRSL